MHKFKLTVYSVGLHSLIPRPFLPTVIDRLQCIKYRFYFQVVIFLLWRAGCTMYQCELPACFLSNLLCKLRTVIYMVNLLPYRYLSVQDHKMFCFISCTHSYTAGSVNITAHMLLLILLHCTQLQCLVHRCGYVLVSYTSLSKSSEDILSELHGQYQTLTGIHLQLTIPVRNWFCSSTRLINLKSVHLSPFLIPNTTFRVYPVFVQW